MYMKKNTKKLNLHIDGPLLDKVKVNFAADINFQQYPFCLPIIKNLKDIEFYKQVTFFVGENGTGKSTILEAIANRAGFGAEGGNRNITFKTGQQETYSGSELLAQQVTLSWRAKPRSGYFFRAESFFNIANYIDHLAREDGNAYTPYGGKSLHAQSHGESFLSFFKSRLGSAGFYIFDEPEAALSPQRQLSLMAIIFEMCKNPSTQFIIATHSPLLLAYPNATIYSCDFGTLKTVTYEQTDHFQITKRFLDNPEYYLQHLFKD